MNFPPAILRQWTRTAAGLLWPARCAACDDPLDDRATPGFCRPCTSAAAPWSLALHCNARSRGRLLCWSHPLW